MYEREPILAADFASILKQYNGLLSRVAAGYEANEALRQELLQEIAVAVWQGLQRFEHKSSLKTYILKIAHNRAVTHVASNARLPRTDELDENTEHGVSELLNPEDATAQDKQLQALLSVVRTLPLPGRQVLTLSLEGLSSGEIADVCGITTSHAGVLLKRTKEEVVRRLNHDE